MKQDDREKFAHAMQSMGCVYRVEITTPMVEGYWSCLGDMTVEEVEDGIKKAMQTCKFMPVPADIREKSGIDEEVPACQRRVYSRETGELIPWKKRSGGVS